MKIWKNTLPAFTIVELLVVVVIIAVLAAISLVMYSGISQKAVASVLQSDLSNAATALKAFQVENFNFPTTVSTDCSASPDTATNKCIKLSSGNNVVGYSANNAISPKTFLLIANNGGNVYTVTDKTAPTLLANVTQPDVTPGAIVELHGAKANAGSSQGINSPLTTTWADTSGNSYNGTLTNFGAQTPWGGAGTAGNPYKLNFDGTDDYVSIASVPTLPSYPYSLEAWFTLGAIARYQGLIRLNSGTNGLPVIAGWTNSRILMYCGSEKYRYSSKTFIAGDVNVLFHVVGVVSGPNTADIHMYLDGALNDGSVGNNSGSINTPTAGPWAVGNTNSVYLSGSVAVARIYPFALSAAQVTANYNAGPDW